MLEAHVDVQRPSLAEALGGIGPAVVVPLLLSRGYHVHVDIAETAAAAGPGVRVAPALGPDSVLVGVLVDRLTAAGLAADHAVVLAAAGSSDPRAKQDVELTARELAQRLCRDVVAAYAAAAQPRVDEVVAGLAAARRRVALASYLLAPGHFYDRLRDIPANLYTDPLLPHPKLVELVLRRYDDALSHTSGRDRS